MIKPYYTISHNIEILKEIDNGGGRFTAEEHEYAIKKEFSANFDSRESLLRYWFNAGGTKQLATLAFLIQFINENGFKKIISLGAGTCVLEYFLKFALPEDAKIAATDFNRFYVDRAKMLLPGIITAKYDFFKDDFKELTRSIGFNPEIALFLGSTGVMDNDELINVLKQLKNSGIRCVIDFQGLFATWKVKLRYLRNDLIYPLASNETLRKALGKRRLSDIYKGKLLGYVRDRGELLRLYQASGFKEIEEMKLRPAYEYAAILR
jgi:hypothetical protein